MICQIYADENYTLERFKINIHVNVSQLEIPVEEMQKYFFNRSWNMEECVKHMKDKVREKARRQVMWKYEKLNTKLMY